MPTPVDAEAARERIDLAIDGMTCSSCAARIEKRLNRIDGVTATVNYATEQANVTHGPTVSTEDLIAQVEAAGYTARLPRAPASPDTTGPDAHVRDDHDETDDTENEADRRARGWLLPTPLPTPRARVGAGWVDAVADERGLAPIVIVGQLQRRQVLDWRTTLARNAPTVTEVLATW